jgi:hypothetical protein
MTKNEIAIAEVLLNTHDIPPVSLSAGGMTYFRRCDTPDFSGTANMINMAIAMNTGSLLYVCKFMS